MGVMGGIDSATIPYRMGVLRVSLVLLITTVYTNTVSIRVFNMLNTCSGEGMSTDLRRVSYFGY